MAFKFALPVLAYAIVKSKRYSRLHKYSIVAALSARHAAREEWVALLVSVSG